MTTCFSSCSGQKPRSHLDFSFFPIPDQQILLLLSSVSSAQSQTSISCLENFSYRLTIFLFALLASWLSFLYSEVRMIFKKRSQICSNFLNGHITWTNILTATYEDLHGFPSSYHSEGISFYPPFLLHIQPKDILISFLFPEHTKSAPPQGLGNCSSLLGIYYIMDMDIYYSVS